MIKQTINIKAGEDNYGHPTAIVGKEKINFHEMRSRETNTRIEGRERELMDKEIMGK